MSNVGGAAMRSFVKHFLEGLLVLLPVVVTTALVVVIFTKLETMVFDPIGSRAYEGAEWLKTTIGIAVTVGLIFLVGLLASNILGKRMVHWVDRLLNNLPLIKILYGSIKDLLSAFVGDKKSFDKPVLVGLSEDATAKVIGFVTREDLKFLGIENHVAVYLPQSYNFAGNLLVVPSDRITPLNAVSSDVMAFLISGGVSGESGAENPST